MLIEVEKLNYTYASSEKEKVHALKDVSLNIRQGEFVALVGSSGSGKSTFVRHLNGLIKADSGDIRFQGESIYQKKYPISKLRQKVGLVFQYPEHQLFSRSVLADVAFGPRNMGDSKEEAENKAKAALEKVGIGEELFKGSPYELSGGQMRRVAIAGILAMEPEVLVLDEPTAGLDPYVRNQLLNLLKKMQKSGVTILLVSHSMEEVANYADRVVVFHSGRICMDGSPEEVFADKEKIRKAGLEMPQVMEALWQLKEQGIPVHEFTCNEKAATCQIVDIIKKKEA